MTRSPLPPYPDTPQPWSRWRHVSGAVVEVQSVARWEPGEGAEFVVCYLHDGEVWCRPLHVFLDRFTPEPRHDHAR